MNNETVSTVYSSPGYKLDEGKPRFELIPAEAQEALAKLYADGALKYGDRNWEKGMSMCRLFGALMRHAWKWMRGETYDIDPKTGAIHHHMIQVAWNAFAIYTLDVREQKQYDDRPDNVNTGRTGDTTSATGATERSSLIAGTTSPTAAYSAGQAGEAYSEGG